ncbi:hypothetical protein ACIQCG_41775 [Streptomyces noursei]|uniref:hypothetical protein n=1 Tax=Streptomyces noursei TaxID=1971 RepID=UPI00382F64CF
MATYQPDPNHQFGSTTPPQTTPRPIPRRFPTLWLRCPRMAVQKALEALQRPAGAQPSGTVTGVACGGTDGAPVLAVAISHPTTGAAPHPSLR